MADVPWIITDLDSALLIKLDDQYRFKHHEPMDLDMPIMLEDEPGETRQVSGLFFRSKPLAEALTPLCNQATEEFGITFTGFEPFNYLVYGVADYYSWHVDNDLIPAQERKYTITIALNDPDEYEGGGLEIQWPNPHTSHRISLNRCQAVVFPSILTHRARRLKKGERRVIVAWATGYPYQ